jgi:hypothetical protein
MSEDFAILQHPDEPRALLLPEAGGWTLPRAQHDEHHFWQVVAPVNRAFGELLGAGITTLRCVRTDYQRSFYAIELQSKAWSPPAGARCADRDDLDRLTLAEPAQCEALHEWFDWNERRLAEAFELAQTLSNLHHAVTYHQCVLPSMEQKWEMWNMIPFYLRKLLK